MQHTINIYATRFAPRYTLRTSPFWRIIPMLLSCMCTVCRLKAGAYAGGGGFKRVWTNPPFQLERRNLNIHPARERRWAEGISLFTVLANEAERLHCIGENHKYVGVVDCRLSTPNALPYKPPFEKSHVCPWKEQILGAAPPLLQHWGGAPLPAPFVLTLLYGLVELLEHFKAIE